MIGASHVEMCPAIFPIFPFPINVRTAPLHTVAIWTFPFHKISGFVRVILKGNFTQLYRPKVSMFWSEHSDLLFLFSFYFLQNLSKPLLFAHCCCYFKELTCLNCVLMQKSQYLGIRIIDYTMADVFVNCPKKIVSYRFLKIPTLAIRLKLV